MLNSYPTCPTRPFCHIMSQVILRIYFVSKICFFNFASNLISTLVYSPRCLDLDSSLWETFDSSWPCEMWMIPSTVCSKYKIVTQYSLSIFISYDGVCSSCLFYIILSHRPFISFTLLYPGISSWFWLRGERMVDWAFQTLTWRWFRENLNRFNNLKFLIFDEFVKWFAPLSFRANLTKSSDHLWFDLIWFTRGNFEFETKWSRFIGVIGGFLGGGRRRGEFIKKRV